MLIIFQQFCDFFASSDANAESL